MCVCARARACARVNYDYICETFYLEKNASVDLSLSLSVPLSFNAFISAVVSVPAASFCLRSIFLSLSLITQRAQNDELYVHVRELPTCCPAIPSSSDLHRPQILTSCVIKLWANVCVACF